MVGRDTMGEPESELVIEEPAEGVLTLTGELDADSAVALEARIHRLVTAGADHITVDAAGLAFCDSTGLGVFVEANHQLPDQHGLTLRNPRHQLRRRLAVTGLTDILT